ncbi:ATP-binding cassette domain-containing protein [Brevundimonas sp.]|uniref:amino acid ABC transporter ATP-binding/permease protein n=1 Tax=Brevundimonas sp. TaxID=1871086 RepID=UPI0025C2C3AC|nr:ATP-binding cassette domain-containing protein [Brevundimonas sp.]
MSRAVEGARIRAMIAGQRRLERSRLRLAAAGGAAVSVAAVCLLGLSGWFITGAALAGVAGLLAAQTFNYLMPSAIIRLLAIIRTGARYVERVAGHEAALRALSRLRPQLFSALAAAPPERALGLSSGEASARLIQDVDAIQTLFVRLSTPWALGAGAMSAIILTSMATPTAGLLLALTLGIGAFGSVILARRLADPAGRELQVAVGALKDHIGALEAAAPEMKAYGLQDWAADSVASVAARHDAIQTRLTLAAGWIALWQSGVTALAVVLVVPATVGASLPMTALAALAAVMGVEAASGLAGALHQNGAAAQAMSRLEDLTSAPSAHLQAEATSRGLGLPARNIALTPGMRLSFTGPSGVGKTSLIERLAGLRPARPGEWFVGETDAAHLRPEGRRTLFAYAAQDVRLLDGTVRQNLLLAGPADDAALWRALEDAALADRIQADPRGLDAPVGAGGEFLSGGERRRLGLARAYLRNAPWLLLDEPTEGLDAATEGRVLEALERRLARTGQGLLIVSHHPAPLSLCQVMVEVGESHDPLKAVDTGALPPVRDRASAS